MAPDVLSLSCISFCWFRHLYIYISAQILSLPLYHIEAFRNVCIGKGVFRVILPFLHLGCLMTLLIVVHCLLLGCNALCGLVHIGLGIGSVSFVEVRLLYGIVF